MGMAASQVVAPATSPSSQAPCAPRRLRRLRPGRRPAGREPGRSTAPRRPGSLRRRRSAAVVAALVGLRPLGNQVTGSRPAHGLLERVMIALGVGSRVLGAGRGRHAGQRRRWRHIRGEVWLDRSSAWKVVARGTAPVVEVAPGPRRAGAGRTAGSSRRPSSARSRRSIPFAAAARDWSAPRGSLRGLLVPLADGPAVGLGPVGRGHRRQDGRCVAAHFAQQRHRRRTPRVIRRVLWIDQFQRVVRGAARSPGRATRTGSTQAAVDGVRMLHRCCRRSAWVSMSRQTAFTVARYGEPRHVHRLADARRKLQIQACPSGPPPTDAGRMHPARSLFSISVRRSIARL